MFKENFGLIMLVLCFLFSVGSCTAYNINKDNIISKKDMSCKQLFALTNNQFSLISCKDDTGYNRQ